MKKQDKILALRVALLIAYSEAEKLKTVEDDGTCNFDCPIIYLEAWSKRDVLEAFKLTGLSPYFKDGGGVEIEGACNGIGARRTAMAEAFRDSLKAQGYKAYVHYVMD